MRPIATPPDQEVRDRITKMTDRSFFVEAAAGSGKTTALVERMFNMVINGTQVSKISAITFTKAAANEFYKRFQERLAECVDDPGAEDKDRERCRKALADIDLCFMGTIDAFCNMVMNEHPTEARINSRSRVVEDSELGGIIAREFSNILRGEYGPKAQGLANRYCKTVGSPAELFTAAMRTMLESRDHRVVRKSPSDPAALQTELYKSMKMAQTMYAFFKKNPKLIYDDGSNKYRRMLYSCSQSAAVFTDPAAQSQGGTYIFDRLRELISALGRLDGIRLNADPAAVGLPQKVCELFRTVNFRGSVSYSFEFKDRSYLYNRLCSEQFFTAMELAATVCEEMSERLLERGELRYFDYLFYLRDMLKRDASRPEPEQRCRLIKYICDRHSYYLIDEFQDTDPLQAEIFFYLSAAENAVPEWEKCVPRPGSMFIVGDPKQAIYSFKGADVGTFAMVRSLFKGEVGTVEELTFNFRSTPKMCRWFNDTFSWIMAPDPEGGTKQAAFTPIPVIEDELLSPAAAPDGSEVLDGAFLLPFEGKSDMAYVRDAVTYLVGNPGLLIQPEPEKPPRTVRYSDIMIITPWKMETAGYKRVLAAAGVPARVEGACDFTESMALTELVKILTAMAYPRDGAAVYGALTGRYFGISPRHLTEMGRDPASLEKARAEHKAPEEGKDMGYVKRMILDLYSPELDQRFSDSTKDIRSACGILKKLILETYGMTPSAAFSYTAGKLRIFARTGDSDMQYFSYALELLRDGEHNGSIVSLKDAADLLNGLTDRYNSKERCLILQEDADCVHIANLHKVKGLESPIVILASPAAQNVSADQSVIRKPGAKAEHYYFEFSHRDRSGPAMDKKQIKCRDYQDRREAEERNLIDERKRLLYVAATRAMCVLIVSDDKKWRSEDNDLHKRLTRYWRTLSMKSKKDTLPTLKVDTAVSASNIRHFPAPDKGVMALYQEVEKNSKLAGLPEKKKPAYALARPSDLKRVGPVDMEGDKPSDEANLDPQPVTEPSQSAKHFGLIPADLKGTMIHRLMEILVLSKLRAAKNIEDLARQIAGEYNNGLDPKACEQAEEMLCETARRVMGEGYPQAGGRQPELIRHILSHADEIHCEMPFCLHCEMPFCLKNSEAITYGLIDLLYREGEQWHVIDYKTNAEGTDLDRKYASQLTAYRRAVSELKNVSIEDVDAYVYHIDV
ncbi:MAG: UvrD-helicase domain-containing protein [Ruminococcus sp.]|nr:UvrD-helicase domain-containing protein [Ruminococcus sp.]